MPGYETGKLKEFFDSLPAFWLTWIKWLGFYKFDEPINLKLLPYVIYFSLSVILYSNFKRKNSYEMREMLTDESFKQQNKEEDKEEKDISFSKILG